MHFTSFLDMYINKQTLNISDRYLSIVWVHFQPSTNHLRKNGLGHINQIIVQTTGLLKVRRRDIDQSSLNESNQDEVQQFSDCFMILPKVVCSLLIKLLGLEWESEIRGTRGRDG